MPRRNNENRGAGSQSPDQARMEDALRNLLRGNELSREGLTLEERKKEILRESLAIQKDIAKGGQNYLDHMKNLKKLLKEINRVEEQISKSKKKIEDLNKKIATATDAEKATLNELIADEKIRLELLINRLKLEKQSAEATQIALRNSSKFSAFYKQSINDLKVIKGAWKSISSFIGGFDDVFKWEKSIKMTAMNMGVLGSRFDGFQKDMVKAATTTAQWGMDITEITKIQGAYSEELGTAVMLSEKGAARLGAMAHVTGLGAEGAGKMAGELGKVGLSAERTANFVEETMQNSSKMGINSGKVIKNIAANLKLLNKYNFKGGTKSLAKMAQYTTKMGVSMNLAGSMADKLMDVEGAVEMSSQLQVLGGEWSKLADPFKLMYMARNDMEGLTKALVGATKNSASFNAKTKEFDLSAQAMAQLREVAKATGADFEELATAAKKAANFAKIEKQIGIGFKDKETKEFIENQATFNEKGEAIIRIDGKDRLVKALNESDKQGIKRAIEEKLKMEDMAKQSQSLDELWKNTVIMLKQLLVPIVDAINKKLMPAMTGLMAKFTDPKFLDGIIEFGKQVGDIIGTVGKFMIENPKWTIAMFGVFEAAKWILNGVKLGIGFNSVARVGGGPTGGSSFSSKMSSGGYTRGANGQIKPMSFGQKAMGKNVFGGKLAMGTMGSMGAGLGLGFGGMAVDYGRSKMDNPESTGGKLLGIGSSALKGAGMGMMFGPWGASIGGVLGGLYGAYDEFIAKGEEVKESTERINDGVVFNPKDKFMKVNDSTMIAGTNENGNKSLAKAIMSATVPGFGMTDYLMNSNKNAGVSGGKSIPGEVHHKFDNDMKVDGRIELVTNGEIVAKIGRELLQNSSFVQSLQQSINKMNLTYGS